MRKKENHARKYLVGPNRVVSSAVVRIATLRFFLYDNMHLEGAVEDAPPLPFHASSSTFLTTFTFNNRQGSTFSLSGIPLSGHGSLLP